MASSYKPSYDRKNFDDDSGGSNGRDQGRPALSMNERIVWISDNGPEYGNVRWLGKLPDLGEEWMAGVEFDNPVGSGTGLYKDKQLFLTPLNHASLVPVIGLLKASDFDGPSITQPSSRPVTRRLIDFNSEPIKAPSHDDIDELYKQFHNRIENLSRNRISESRVTGEDKFTSESAGGYVRHIPIKLEQDNSVIVNKRRDAPPPFLPSVHRKPSLDLATSHNNHRLSDDKSLSTHHNQVHKLSSSLARTSLNDSQAAQSSRDHRQQQHRLGGVPLLPPPALVVQPDDENPQQSLKDALGKSRGIQGHNNSCYLDATLFAMFSTTTLFDSLLYRPPNQNDIPEYSEIQRVLRDDIVRRLRQDHFVSADQVMIFRTILEQSSSVEGLTDEEKDPEEFLSLLLGQILKAEPYLKLSSRLESFFYQLIVDKDENAVLPTVQELFDQSFVSSTVRLSEIPPCLLLQMPRFGRQYKMYPRIMPSLTLDITHVLETAPRSCGHRGEGCDNIASIECKDCLYEQSGRNNCRLASITYCNNCFQRKHFSKSHMTGIEDHDKTKTILKSTLKEAYRRYSNKLSSAKDKKIPQVEMDLFAVLCIETSHYVCFVKCGDRMDSPWCFFDSMADRRGEQNGYNIPEVLLFEEFAYWTSGSGVAYLLNNKDDKTLPEMARRLICDAYLCFYRYNGLSLYR